MSSKNLWGAIPATEDHSSPKRLLQEQAEFLTVSTNGQVRGVVETRTDGNRIINELSIVAPFINNYAVAVLRASHGALIYPVTVYNLLDPQDWEGEECPDYGRFENRVHIVLQSGDVKMVLASLLIQSKEK